ncbi:uncharacterized protein LOC118279355 [Spodoptera frugiperda]|uniref:Uncharacterized protein LOC118279355 n=1 Tax=Spodoptera frugiperda TaxID=7108 RepID=A0A9R0DI96_SPOFR|nr:uncharacterized protein LOC118279355 [Spodoptera frugiperda]XP_035454922.2 uncharacterized protein LOC118279355 [Spodoptera frugiperda]XP_050554375.1 uncharacterized protein LOC118279355 [Spodoptera frugiperda]
MSEDYSTLTNVSPVLTNERLSAALSDWFKRPFTFTHWEYVSETGKGDSYLSELIRIRIHGTDEDNVANHVQVILKTIPKSIARRLTFRSHEFFKNEITFYEKILPALLDFQSTKNVKDPFDKYTKMFFAFCDGTNDVLCLEDVSLYQFGTAVRQEGIDLQHCKLTFKILAQFHALSFALKDQKPEVFGKLKTQLTEVYYHDRLWDWYSRFWKRISGVAIDAVEKEYPDSIYVEKIKEFAVPERYQNMIDAATKTDETAVISHGDSWTNNFLYKYVEGSPVDAKIIDFQLARCATPVLDISFVIYACTTEDLREKHYDDLLKYYYEILSTQIRDLGSDPDKVYPWDLFISEVKKYSYFGLAFSFESTPFIILAPEDAVNMEMKGDKQMNIEDVWQVEPFKTKEGRLREANNVKHCVDRGYI